MKSAIEKTGEILDHISGIDFRTDIRVDKARTTITLN